MTVYTERTLAIGSFFQPIEKKKSIGSFFQSIRGKNEELLCSFMR